MTAKRRWTGYGILLMATLGLILCLGGIAGAWLAKSRLDAAGATAFAAVDEALGFIDAKLDLVQQGFERSRHSVGGLTRRLEPLQGAEPDIPQICQSALQTVETIRQEFQSAESWLESGYAIANGIQRISAAVLSSEFASARPDAAGWTLARDVQEIAALVTDTLAQIQTLRLHLIELRNSGILAREVALAILDRVAHLDARMASLCDRIEKLDGALAKARSACADQGRKFIWWTRLAAVIASLLPLWFGLSQIAMMAWGWRIAHPRQ